MDNRTKIISRFQEFIKASERVGSQIVIMEMETARDAVAMMKELSAFKEYFDGLYGQGLQVANWHMNGAHEPFDSFYESAVEAVKQND